MKIIGNYTTDASKALKTSDRIFCRIDENKKIYVCNGFVLFTMQPLEYSETVQPVTKCEAGNWNIIKGEKSEAPQTENNIIKMFRDSVSACNGGELERCPAEFPAEKAILSSFFSAAGNFASFYNKAFISALAPGLKFRANSALAPAVAFDNNGEAVAMALPVKPDEKKTRAVNAYFNKPAEAAETPAAADNAEAAELREKIAKQAAELESLRADLKAATEYGDAKRAENEELYSRIAELEKRPASPVEPAETPAAPADVKSAAEIIAARFNELDGVETVIKGASTSTPVIWLTGNIKKHDDAIRAAGAKWSRKKGAYYVRVA